MDDNQLTVAIKIEVVEINLDILSFLFFPTGNGTKESDTYLRYFYLRRT